MKNVLIKSGVLFVFGLTLSACSTVPAPIPVAHSSNVGLKFDHVSGNYQFVDNRPYREIARLDDISKSGYDYIQDGQFAKKASGAFLSQLRFQGLKLDEIDYDGGPRSLAKEPANTIRIMLNKGIVNIKTDIHDDQTAYVSVEVSAAIKNESNYYYTSYSGATKAFMPAGKFTRNDIDQLLNKTLLTVVDKVSSDKSLVDFVQGSFPRYK